MKLEKFVCGIAAVGYANHKRTRSEIISYFCDG
jgi:hypothetical protein